MGLYRYVRGGIDSTRDKIYYEVKRCLEINPWYAENVIFLADNKASEQFLNDLGLDVTMTFTDAPQKVLLNKAHFMKYWMCIWALEQHGAFLWLDWDTIAMKKPDDAFWAYCSEGNTPKFIFIPHYHSLVCCGVYYANKAWFSRMKSQLFRNTIVEPPSDELLWKLILPPNLDGLATFWWGSKVLNVWETVQHELVKRETYFLHVRDLDVSWNWLQANINSLNWTF